MQRSFSTTHNSAEFGRLRGESEKIPQRSFSPTYRNSGKNMSNKTEKERPIALPTPSTPSTSPTPSKSSSNVAYNMEVKKPKKHKKKYSKYFGGKRVGSYGKRVEENQTEKLHGNFTQKIPSDYTSFPEAYGAYIGSPRAMCYSEFIRNPFIVESMGSFIVGPRGSCIIDRDGPMGLDFNVPLFSRFPRVSNIIDSTFPFYGNNGYSRVNIPVENQGIFLNSREEPTIFPTVFPKQLEKKPTVFPKHFEKEPTVFEKQLGKGMDEKQEKSSNFSLKEKSLPDFRKINTNPLYNSSRKINAEHQIKGEPKFKESDRTPQSNEVYSKESNWNSWKIIVIISFILILIIIIIR